MKTTVIHKTTTVKLSSLSEGDVFIFESDLRVEPDPSAFNLVTDEGTYVNLSTGCQYNSMDMGEDRDPVKKYFIKSIEFQEI